MTAATRARPRLLGLRLAGALAILAAAAAPAAARVSAEDRLSTIENAIQRWDVQTASWHAKELLAERPKDARALLAAARVAFHRADYAAARAHADAAGRVAAEGSEEAAQAEDFRRYLTEREPIWSTFTEHRSAHFVVRVTPRDAILAPQALVALERAAKVLEEAIGFCPTETVVLEIYPNRRSFIAASTLTREEVETSGTVAICHFNRLMIMSPAVMARGYDWLDTVCHEYVHYAVYHVGEDVVPVWLHEGIAKNLQGRWRDDAFDPLDPHSSTLLGEALETGTWVTFEDMHPSMAKLPSAPLVGLAFAEVTVAVASVMEKRPGALRALVEAVRDTGGDLDEALRRTLGVTFEEFEAATLARVRRLPLYRIAGARLLDGGTRDPSAPRFTDEGEATEDPEQEARELQDRKARDWTILGDRLKGRKAYAAAVIEYDKALARLGHSDPMVVNRKAHAMMLDGKHAEALPALLGILRDYPTLSATLDNLTEVELRLASAAKDPAARRQHLEKALEHARGSERTNPFSPDVHLRLASILERLGRRSEAESARERLDMLRQTTAH